MGRQRVSHQQGGSMIGMLLIAVMVGALGLVAVQVAPTVSEFRAIQKAATKAAGGTTVAEVRSLFDKAASVDDFKSVAGKDLVVTKEGDKVVVTFDYEREIHLFGPAYLTLKYSGRSD